MIILSIDPGIERLGFSIFHLTKGNPDYIASGLITTPKKLSKELRLAKIHSEIEKIINKYKPERVIMEELFFAKNVKTAVVVAQAQGVVLSCAGERILPVTFLKPNEIKQIITGYGFSDKNAIQKMLKLTLKLPKEIKQDDEADAIACGAAYCYLNRNLLQ